MCPTPSPVRFPSPGPVAEPLHLQAPDLQAQDLQAQDLQALRVRRPTTIALVDLDSFYVSVERLYDPGLIGRPVVVGGLPGERGVVACASYEARGHGVRAAMPLSEAAALLPRRCPRCVAAQAEARPAETGCGRGCPVFLHGEHTRYLQASRRVLDVLGRFAPKVEPVSLDEAYLDLSGCERHHRSWLQMALALRQAVKDDTGLSISVGIGGTRAVAAVAAALAKPGGVLVVRAGEERAFLSALPLEHLPGVGPRMREQLNRFHLLTIGDLAALPDDLMQATFGRLGPLLTARARGEEDPGGARIGERVPKSRSISRETSFAADTDDPRVIDGMLSYLAQRAAKALRADGLVARSVGVRLRYADFDTVEMRQRLPEPTDRDHPILEQVRRLWRARWTRRVRLRLVGVVLHDLAPAAERQLTLALTPAPGTLRPSDAVGEGALAFAGAQADVSTVPDEVSRTIDRAVDRIRDRHGFGAIVRGRAIDLLPAPASPAQGPHTQGPPARRRRRARPGADAGLLSAHGTGPAGTGQAGTGPAGTASPASWSFQGLRLATPGCSR